MDQVDLKKINCIPHHQTVAIMNQYLHACTGHINKMADFAEKQMMEIDFLIDELESKVEILERKLGVQEMSQVQPVQSQSQIQSQPQSQPSNSSSLDLLPPPPPPPPSMY